VGRAILVSGLLPHDSGKTYFTASLALGIKSLGYSVKVFKPVAAHNLWYQYRVFRESVRLGVLVGEDVVKYMRLGLVENPDVQNPVDILTGVPDVDSFASIDMYLATLEDAVAQAVLVRLSYGVRRYFLVEDSYRALPPHVREVVDEAVEVFGPATRVGRAWIANTLMSRGVDTALLTATRNLTGKVDFLLIESFNNALTPSASIAQLVDRLVIVAPGKALIYPGNKLRSYITAARSVMELVSRSFARLFRPEYSINVELAEGWPPPALHPKAVAMVVGAGRPTS